MQPRNSVFSFSDSGIFGLVSAEMRPQLKRKDNGTVPITRARLVSRNMKQRREVCAEEVGNLKTREERPRGCGGDSLIYPRNHRRS